MSTQTTLTETPAAPTTPCTVSWCTDCAWESTHIHIIGEVCFERMHRRVHGCWEVYQYEVSSSEGVEVFEPLFEPLQGFDIQGPAMALKAAKHLRKLAQRVAGAL